MQEKTRNIIVGITALAGLAGVLILLLLFGYVPAFLEGGYVLRVQLSNASGLTQGSRVHMSGIDIGRVTEVYLKDPSQHGVEVATLIRDDVRVPSRAHVQAESPLIGGNPTLAFRVDHLTDDLLRRWLPSDGSAVIQGKSLTLVSQFTGEIQAAIAEPTRRFNLIADQIEHLSKEWTKVGKNLNNLIGAQAGDPTDPQGGSPLSPLAGVLTQANQRLSELQVVIDGMNRWVNDEQLRENVVATTTDARKLVHSLGKSVHRLEKRFTATADDLSGMIGSVRTLVDQARSGEGTIGKLFNDSAVYDNLNDAAQRLEKTLDEFRLLAEKWKAEGLPVQF